MKKRLLAILLTVCMVISMAPAAFAAGSVFTDVNAGDWFAEEVEYVYDNGLMNGVGDNKFDPNGTVTRAMMWTTLARIAGENTTGSDPWWLAGQQWAMETGVSDGTMATDNITREQLVTMLYRYAQLKGYDVSVGEDTNILSYTDAFDVNEWAISAMQWACGAGIINGIDGALQPQGYATRAQLAAILYRFVEEVVNAAPATYTVTFMWNYGNKGVYETVQVEDGETVGSLRNPSRSGYSFSGWYTEDGDRFTLNTKVTEDIVVYAKWSEYVYIPVHTHSWTAGTPVPPTCSSEGYTPYTCVCGATKNDDFVPAFEHVAGEECPYCGVIEVETAEQLAAALSADAENINVVLRNDIEVPVASLSQYGQTPGSGEYKLGGDSTTAITIDLNGHTLTLTTSYMTAIGAKNDNATITIKNGSMNGTGNSATTWNINDLIFANCNYVFEDVTFQKEVALCNTGKTVTMTDVTINGTGDYYALWIQAEGQTVNIDGLTVNTPGRGIKIDEQYSNENVAKVTLTVSDAEFTTAKKAAIMVKSAEGADITLSDVDISSVAADTVNEVWVDSDSAAYQNLVTVTGGNKVLEGAVAKIGNTCYKTLADAITAVQNGDTIVILPGTYAEVLDVRGGKTFTVKAEEADTVVIAGINQQTNGDTASTVTFENLTIDNSKAIEGWFTGTAQNIFPCVGAWGGNLSFENCTFEVAGTSKKETGIMTWWTTNKVTLSFNECTFNGIDDHASARAMQIYGNVDMTVTDCEFNTYKDYTLKYVGNEGCTATLSGNKVYNSDNFVELGSSTYPGSKYTVYLNDNTLGENVSNFVIANPENQIVYVDGAQAITSADELAAALSADAENINVVLRNDIEVPVASLSQYGQTPGSGEYKLGGDNTTAITIDLNGHKLTLTTSYMTAIGAKNDNATITIKNGSMNGTGNTSTTWNINDLIFANCNYVFDTVTFDKEVALCNTGKTVIMNDVTINGTGDYYALWIQAEGQTVNVDGLTVNTSGRGIKIDEQYSNEKVAEVTLTLTDAKFTTAKKAAVMVKSAAGADITVNSIDITGVTADTTNAVWVDSDAAAYADMVTVTGATMIVEN